MQECTLQKYTAANGMKKIHLIKHMTAHICMLISTLSRHRHTHTRTSMRGHMINFILISLATTALLCNHNLCKSHS